MNEYEEEALEDRRIIIKGIREEIEYHKERIESLKELLQHSLFVLNKRG